MERYRCFIALALPVGAATAVRALQKRAREQIEGEDLATEIRWVPAPNLHLTLKFLGEIPAESVYAIRDKLKERLDGRNKLRVKISGVGLFPDGKQPRVLWTGLAAAQEDADELDTLAKDIDGWMEELGFPQDKRAFRAHITLARIKAEGAALAEHQGWQAFAQNPGDPIDAELSEVVVYRSQLRAKGAEYTALERIALKGHPRRNERGRRQSQANVQEAQPSGK